MQQVKIADVTADRMEMDIYIFLCIWKRYNMIMKFGTAAAGADYATSELNDFCRATWTFNVPVFVDSLMKITSNYNFIE